MIASLMLLAAGVLCSVIVSDGSLSMKLPSAR